MQLNLVASAGKTKSVEVSDAVFANAFIKALKNNNNLLEGQELYRLVSSSVIAAAEQVPQYDPIKFSGHEVGDFFFIPK